MHAQLKQLRNAWGSLDFFCINDTTDDARHDDPRLMQVRQTLQTLLHAPSVFETPSLTSPVRQLLG